MRLHLLNARRLAEDLAAGRVKSHEQAAYLAISFIAWLFPYYLGFAVSPTSFPDAFATALYWSEFAMLVLINWFGLFHCLRQCRIDPSRHFMIDFGCLYAPVTIVVMAGTWALFHAAMWGVPRMLHNVHDAGYLYLRAFDTLRYITIVGQMFLIYAVVGHYMRRAAQLRV